jgi:hypothetical protein
MILEHKRRLRKDKLEKARKKLSDVADEAAAALARHDQEPDPSAGSSVDTAELDSNAEPVGLKRDLAHEMTEPFVDSEKIDDQIAAVDDKQPAKKKKGK